MAFRVQVPGSGAQLSDDSCRCALWDMVAESSIRLARLLPDEADAEIQLALQRIQNFFDLDRCVLASHAADAGRMDICNQAQRADLPRLPECCGVEHVAGAMLEVPAGDFDGIRYFVGLVSRPGLPALSLLQVRCLRLLSESLASAAYRTRLERARADAARFDRLIAELSGGFFGIEDSQIDQQLEDSLKALMAFTNADRCTIYMILDDPAYSRVTHLASRRATLPIGTIIEHRKVKPWLWDRVVRRQVPLAFSSLDDLPPEAAAERQYFAGAATQAGLYLPFGAEATARVVLAVVFRQSPSLQWSEEFVERLRVLGKVFASVLMRRDVAAAQPNSGPQLRDSRRFAHATLSALNEFVCVIDADGGIVETNDAWRLLTTRARLPVEAASVGSNLLRAFETAAGPHGAYFQQLAPALRDLLSDGAASFESESARTTMTGETDFMVRASRFVVDGMAFAVISVRDVSTQRRVEGELAQLRARYRHADRVTRTGVLIASLAHELRQPLGAILSNAQAGLHFIGDGKTPDLQEIRAILADIVADDKRAARVIESLRLMIKRDTSERRPEDIAAVAHDVVALMHTEFITQRVRIDEHFEAGCLASVDRAQLQQVLLNLILNSLEAMESVPDASRQLSLCVSKVTEGNVRIAVSDTGTGFTQESLEKAFHAFWTTKARGTGLGLAICHSIVREHGGRIRVESREGPGTTLVIELPGLVQAVPVTDMASQRRA